MVENELYLKFTTNVDSVYKAISDLLKGMIEFTKENRDRISIYSDLGSGSMNRFAAIASDKFKNATSLYILKLVDLGKEIGEIDKNMKSDLAACLIDNYITLFSYSLVSEYHAKRFDAFLSMNGRAINDEERADIIIDSLKVALKK